MAYLAQHQLSIMFVLECLCALQILFCFIMDIKPREKKIGLVLVEASAAVLLWADRNAYIYRGDTSDLGFYMVRITNFLVFAMNYLILDAVTGYIKAIVKQLGDDTKLPKITKIIRPATFVGVFLLVLSQFTGMYYTFDENNLYHRSDFFIICYIVPLLILVILLSVIIKIRHRLARGNFISLLLFAIAPIVASIIQVFSYGVSLTNMAIGFSTVLLYMLAIVDQNKMITDASQREIETLKEMNSASKEQFRKTVLALANAIDAKDQYTHGHSRRVAEYSMKIARAAGKDDTYCEKIYMTAILHDVGKIGIPDAILRKEGRLTDEEFGEIKKHPSLGNQILSDLGNHSYLTVGAHHHHERFDGKGYPDGLYGEEIPEMARIIAVADAYDAMTSSRSYRTPLAQQIVREELVKGLGTQFDPHFATIMINIMDKDSEYSLKDDGQRINEIKDNYTFTEDKKLFTSGIRLLENQITRISFAYESLGEGEDCVPSLVIYDALDETAYSDEMNQKKMEYTDFCNISINGKVVPGKIRDIRMQEYPNYDGDSLAENELIVETVKQRDHALVRFTSPRVIREYTIALIDRSQFAFTAISGKQCKINKVDVDVFERHVLDGYIKRIADEVSYIDGCEVGDMRNLEIAGWREDHSEPIVLDGKVEISLHSKSLPASRRLWHCPIVTVYTSENGKVYGPGFREFALVRFDGESWEEDTASTNEITVSYEKSFDNWDAWKKKNREGVDCTISIKRSGNTVVLKAQNAGVRMENVTKISEDIPTLYCAITGDQVAITNIRVRK